MRKFIIDTDTGSDDAIAIVMALNEPSVKVEAIISVAGNVVIESATNNALISVEYSGTYQPPVYEGLGKPLAREQITAVHAHGDDGMGDVGYKTTLKKAEGHGVYKMLEIIKETDDIELVALGPLTNVAAAIINEPETMKRIKRIWLMGGAFLGGNITPNAEFNIYADPEAADIVFKSGIPITMSPIENCMGENLIFKDEYEDLDAVSPLGHFCVHCNAKLKNYILKATGIDAFAMPDPMAMAIALWDDCDDKMVSCHVDIETGSIVNYGRTSCDLLNKFGLPANADVCTIFNKENFKKHLWVSVANKEII